MKPLLYLVALFSIVSSAAADPSAISGHVRQADGQPVAGAQVALFAVTDLAAGAVAQATTDDVGYFALPLPGTSRPLPAGFALGPNYPNPFNPSTIIPYQLPVATPVRLEIFNVLGQHVKTLVEGERPAGAHTALWDATDATGQAVGAGVYFYRLSGGGAQWTRKMVLVDGQAGRSAAAGGGVAARPGGDETDAPVYGLTVLGEGLVPYVDPAFRVEGGMGPVEVVLAAPARAKRLQEEDRLLGDVDGNGRVDMVDALLVAAYIGSYPSVGDIDGDGVEDSARTVDLINLGDVNGDGLLTLHDAYLIGVYSTNPADPVLPAGIGERVSSASGGTLNPTKMYWTDWSTAKIQRANLDGSQIEDLITTGLEVPLGIALDVGRGKMYWTDGETDKIQRANLDGSQVEDLITTGLSWPVGLALDVGRGKMYWTDSGRGKIQRANLDGSQVEDLITSRRATGLALDVGRGKMYWTDWSTAKIQRANLDGSQAEDLITTGLGAPLGLALDVGRGKMYWTDGETDKIQRANLDGSQVEDLITTRLREPVGLALDVGRGKMYWTDEGTDKIRRANLDGSQVEDLITTGLGAPLGIALDDFAVSGGSGRPDLIIEASVRDSLLTPGQSFSLRARVRNSSPIRSAATTLRYYRSTDATISTSDTPVGTDEVGELAALDTSAEAIDLTAPSNTGTYYYGACVESVSGESNTDNNCSDGVLVTVRIGTPKMYWTNSDRNRIQRANLDGSQVAHLITTGVWSPKGIALHVGRGKMYWTADRVVTTSTSTSTSISGRGKIQRANLDGSKVEDLITTGLGYLDGIALDVGRGKMYWVADGGFGPDKIQRANLDGSQVETLITSRRATGIALDGGRGKMYWTTSRKIQRANLDGSQVEDLITTGLSDPYGLALDGGRGKMYWTDWITDKIQRANLDGSQVEDLITTGLRRPKGLALDGGRGKMYWVADGGFGPDKIQRANLDGSQVEDLITTGLSSPYGIALDTSGVGSR